MTQVKQVKSRESDAEEEGGAERGRGVQSGAGQHMDLDLFCILQSECRRTH